MDKLVYWRGTNRKSEINDVKNGIAIKSKNHANGHQENGMSVSFGIATVCCYAYKYAYLVSGSLAGFGSDGEPVLTNVIPLTDIMTARQAVLHHDKLMISDDVYSDRVTIVSVKSKWGSSEMRVADIKKEIADILSKIDSIEDQTASKICLARVDALTHSLPK